MHDDDGWSDDLPWIGQYILDENGNPQRAKSLLSWAEWMQKADRKIALTQIANVRVSTVFLGLDYNHAMTEITGKRHTSLFETMVFGGIHDHLIRRYATREDAIEGHRQIVQMHTN